jgi:hypothetical protein
MFPELMGPMLVFEEKMDLIREMERKEERLPETRPRQ